MRAQFPIVLSLGADNNSCVMPSGFTIILNGAPSNLGQAALTRPDNLYTASPVYFGNDGPNCKMSLDFQSYDNSDTAMVTNCIATPVVQTQK